MQVLGERLRSTHALRLECGGELFNTSALIAGPLGYC
jgi:hypothetical protein